MLALVGLLGANTITMTNEHNIASAATTKKVLKKKKIAKKSKAKITPYNAQVIVKKKTLPLYNSSLTKVTKKLKNVHSIHTSSVMKINNKIVAYRYSATQWIKKSNIISVKPYTKTSSVKLAPNFSVEKETWKVGYNGAYLMDKNHQKLSSIDVGSTVNAIGVGESGSSRIWELKDGSFIYAKYLVSSDSYVSKKSTTTSISQDILSPDTVNQLKDPSLPLLSKYNLVKSLSDQQHQAAEKLLMDQMGLSLISSSSFENQMNKINQTSSTVNNWIH